MRVQDKDSEAEKQQLLSKECAEHEATRDRYAVLRVQNIALMDEIDLLKRRLGEAATPMREAAGGHGGRMEEGDSWQELRHIQCGVDKWFKVPASVDYGTAARKAQQALREAEKDLQKSADRGAKYKQPWTPPAFGRFAANAREGGGVRLEDAFNSSDTGKAAKSTGGVTSTAANALDENDVGAQGSTAEWDA